MTMLYLARMDVTPSFLPIFEEWYDTRHAPDLITSGFHSCSAFYATDGAPLVHNVYLIPSVDIFSSPKYLGARDPKVDTLRPTVLDNVSNRSNTPYAQRLVLNTQPGDIPEVPFAAAAQFDSTDDVADLDARFTAAFAQYGGRVRLCQRSGSHLNVSEEPEYYVFAQADTEETQRQAVDAISAMLGSNETGVKRQALRHRITFRA
jgi:hypothetical protein